MIHFRVRLLTNMLGKRNKQKKKQANSLVENEKYNLHVNALQLWTCVLGHLATVDTVPPVSFNIE